MSSFIHNMVEDIDVEIGKLKILRRALVPDTYVEVKPKRKYKKRAKKVAVLVGATGEDSAQIPPVKRKPGRPRKDPVV